MNINNRATKLYLKSLAPIKAYELIDKYRIPSPYKEILIVCCILKLKDFEAISKLEKEYHIYIGYWTYVRKLKEALCIFYKSHIDFCKI